MDNWHKQYKAKSSYSFLRNFYFLKTCVRRILLKIVFALVNPSVGTYACQACMVYLFAARSLLRAAGQVPLLEFLNQLLCVTAKVSSSRSSPPFDRKLPLSKSYPACQACIPLNVRLISCLPCI